MSQIVVVRETTVNPVDIWDIDAAGNLSNRESLSSASDNPKSADVSSDRKWLAIGDQNSDIHLYPYQDGDLGTPVKTVINDGAINAISFSNDSAYLAAHALFGDMFVYSVNSDGTLTQLDNNTGTNNGSPTEAGNISWASDDSTIVASRGREADTAYWSFDGSSLTLLGTTGSLTTSSNDTAAPEFITDDLHALVGQHQTTATGAAIRLYELDKDAGTVWTQLDSVTLSLDTEDDVEASPDGSAVFVARDASDALIYPVASFVFGTPVTLPNGIQEGAWVSNSIIVGAEGGTSSTVRVFSWDGTSATLADTATGSSIDDAMQVIYVASESGPTTNEELFQASYADASAADPKVTALIRPADVQRSIDTDVSNLKDGPNLYTVEAIFDIGELENLNPYNSTTEKPRAFFVKDDQPGLRDGKNLLLKSYTIRDADPAVPVTCTFWG